MRRRYEIQGWTPGKEEHDTVWVVERIGDGGTRSVCEATLRDAKFIAECVNYCCNQALALDDMTRERNA